MRRLFPGRSRDRDRCDHRSPDGLIRCQLRRDHAREFGHVAQHDGRLVSWYGVVGFPPPRHRSPPWAEGFPRDEP